jgi:hypothetical protein
MYQAEVIDLLRMRVISVGMYTVYVLINMSAVCPNLYHLKVTI